MTQGSGRLLRRAKWSLGSRRNPHQVGNPLTSRRPGCYSPASRLYRRFSMHSPISRQSRRNITQNYRPFCQAKRDHFCKLVTESRFEFEPAKGTFPQILDYSAITDENKVACAKRLTSEIGIASIPISVSCEEPQGFEPWHRDTRIQQRFPLGCAR